MRVSSCPGSEETIRLSVDCYPLGFRLSCGRDFAMFEGLAPELRFARTQARMEGAEFCDFRYSG